jgi:hypothetical protein
VSRTSGWWEFPADAYLDHRQRNWVLAEEQGHVVYVPARVAVLVHRERAEHVARALGADADLVRLELAFSLPAREPVRRPPSPAPAAAPAPQPLAAGMEVSRRRGHEMLGWLGILAAAVVFGATLAVPLDDPALVMALMLGVRGGRLLLAVDS